MGFTKFTLTLNETGKKVSKTLKCITIDFINSYWSYDKEGKQKIKQAKLSETVYFYAEVVGLPSGTELEFKLYDSDVFLLEGLDDDEFPEDEFIIKTKVLQKGELCYAQIKLFLNPKWEGMLRDDYGYDLELYWKINFTLPNSEKRNDYRYTPTKKENYLEVEFSDQDLYILPAANSYDFPELIANDGSPIVLMNLAKKMYGGKVKGAINGTITRGIEKTIHNIALAKLEKGMLVTQNNGVIVANKQIYGKNYISVDKATMKMYGNLNTNGKRIFLEGTRNKYGTYLSVKDGEIMQHRDIVSNGKTIKNVAQPKKIAGSSSIDQYAYFTNTGKRVSILRTVSKVGNIWDLYSLGKFMADEDATSKNLPIPHPLAPITDLIMADYIKQEKEFYDTWINDDMLKAKSEGVKAVKEYINSQKHNHNKGFNWRYLEVSNETVNQLLSGEFRTFDKLEQSKEFNGNNTIIYKRIKDDKKGYQYEVHSIFINE